MLHGAPEGHEYCFWCLNRGVGGAGDEGPELEGVVRAGADGVDATGEGLTGHTRATLKSSSH
jgi:hypothetical protein